MAVCGYRDGKVNVGTARKGQPFERWSFNLTSYDDNEDRDACVRLEWLARGLPPGPLMSTEACSRSDSDAVAATRMDGLATVSAAFSPEATAPVEQRFPRRRCTQVQQPQPSECWSDFELSRVGRRHDRARQAAEQQHQDLRAALVRMVSNVSTLSPIPLAPHQPLTRVSNASRQAAAQQELRASRLRESAQLAVSNAAMASVAALSRDVACSAADAAQQRKAARAAAAVAEKARHKLLQAEQQLAQARQRPPRLPRQQRRPQIPKGVRAVFQDLETVLSEANLFADDPLPPLSSDFGVLCDQ